MDLHGMHVDEAIGVLERQIDALKRLVLPDGVLLKVRGVTHAHTYTHRHTHLVCLYVCYDLCT